MSKYRMPKNRKEFEKMLINAFDMGMECGYAVEHTEKSDDEKVLRNRYRALVQGKISSMSEAVDDEKTFTEKMEGL